MAIRGSVVITLSIRNEQEILAQLDAGSMFGMLPFLTGEPHSAGCSVRAGAMLVELMREPVKQLLDTRSALVAKLLGVLSHGLIAAVRRADRQLMQITADEQETTAAADSQPRDLPARGRPSIGRQQEGTGRAQQIPLARLSRRAQG